MMDMKIFCSKNNFLMSSLFIILFEIGFGIKFNIVGTISLSELFLVIFAPFFINKKIFKNYPELNRITLLYIGLLSIQIISEIIVGNRINNSLKGIAITIISYLHVVFLFRYFVKDQRYIVTVFVGVLIYFFFFPASYEGSISGILSGEISPAYIKFRIAPIVAISMAILSVFWRKQKMSLFIASVGILLVIIGARSSGLILFLTGIVSFLVLSNSRSISLKKWRTLLITVSIIGYGLYAAYVHQVLSGEISSGNSWQLLEMSQYGLNPYNPFALLVRGRSEVFVAISAFIDNFWIGHGAWAKDVTGKYRDIGFLLHNMEDGSIYSSTDIPTHSVFFGVAMNNGIFAFICILAIFFFFLKRGYKVISQLNPYLLISVFCIIRSIWIGFFSPHSHFRITLPVYFAFLLASYIVEKKKNENNEILSGLVISKGIEEGRK